MSRRWHTLIAIDFDRWAAETYRANFPGVRVECGPVADHLDALPAADVILGGPPCQPFSQAGERKGKDDARDCVPDFLAAIDRVKPRQFLMENVEGFMTIEGGRYSQRVFADIGTMGYVPAVQVLDAVNYGVPQFRSRCWWWGIRADLYVAGVRHRWPKPTHQWPWPEPGGLFGDGYGLKPAVTVGQALGLADIGIRRLAGPNSQQAKYGHTYTEHEPCPAIGGVEGGKSGLVVHEYRWSDAMLEKHPPASPASPAPTVQAKWFKGGAEGLLTVTGGERGSGIIERHGDRGASAVVEPAPTVGNPANGSNRLYLQRDGLRVRRLTPDECLRLQSGPDDFRWPDAISKTAKYRIVGNGWACGIAAKMSRALADADPESRTVIDLFCGGGLGACGWHDRHWTYQAEQEGTPTTREER